MKKLIFPLILLLISLTSCEKTYTSHSFFAMDTFISVDAENADTTMLKELEKLVCEDEKKFSRTFAGSGIYEFNKNSDGSVLSRDTVALLEKALEMHLKTDGAFSPFMGYLSDLWNIKSQSPKVPTDTDIQSALENCNSSDFGIADGVPTKSNPNLLMDLGGIAKGESAQNCIEYLKSNNVKNAVLSFGGSVACIGHSQSSTTGWVIGIKNPFDTHDVIGTINVTDCYVAVSGAYERSFLQNGKRYHHILDPKTGYPAESDIESTAVISENGAEADGLSTALFVMGKSKALEFYQKGIYDFEAILILKDGTVIVTEGLAENFTFNENAYYNNEKNLVYNK